MEAFKKDVDAYLRELKKVLPGLRDKTRITFAWSASTLDKNCMLVDFQFRRSPLSALIIRDIKNTRCMAGRTDLLEVFLKKMDAFARRNDLIIRRK